MKQDQIIAEAQAYGDVSAQYLDELYRDEGTVGFAVCGDWTTKVKSRP